LTMAKKIYNPVTNSNYPVRKTASSKTPVGSLWAKETMKEVKKVWGKEVWIVNCEKYCGKLLYLDKGAVSSMHYHITKQETFYALSGQTALTIGGKDYMLNPYSRPKTIYPFQEHQFRGFSKGIVILEISTHHKEEDVVRLTQSQPAQETKL